MPSSEVTCRAWQDGIAEKLDAQENAVIVRRASGARRYENEPIGPVVCRGFLDRWRAERLWRVRDPPGAFAIHGDGTRTACRVGVNVVLCPMDESSARRTTHRRKSN